MRLYKALVAKHGTSLGAPTSLEHTEAVLRDFAVLTGYDDPDRYVIEVMDQWASEEGYVDALEAWREQRTL